MNLGEMNLSEFAESEMFKMWALELHKIIFEKNQLMNFFTTIIAISLIFAFILYQKKKKLKYQRKALLNESYKGSKTFNQNIQKDLLDKMYLEKQNENTEKKENIGEKFVQESIKDIIKDKEGYHLFNNVCFYNPHKHYKTEIDHVLVINNQVYAIETKYWVGDTYLLHLENSTDDNKKNNAEDTKNKFLYCDYIVLNDKGGGKVNTYPSAYSNAITQTVIHAANLKHYLSEDVDFVQGILVFVDNDICKVKFKKSSIGNAGVLVMSLTELKEYIRNKDVIQLSCNERIIQKLNVLQVLE